MHPVLENLLIMVLTIVVLVVGGYALLLILEWGLKLKSGRREQEGLTSLWAAAHKQKARNPHLSDASPPSPESTTEVDPP